MARIQVSTSRLNPNTAIAGHGKGIGFNGEIHGTNAGIGLAGTDGYKGESDGNFEVLDAVPAWYLRDQVTPEQTLRVPGESDLRVQLDGDTVFDGDIVHGVFFQRGINSVYLTTAQNTAGLANTLDSEIRSIKVGDSISTVDSDRRAAGVIIDIVNYGGNNHAQFHIQLTQGDSDSFVDAAVVSFGIGALVNPVDSDTAKNFAQGTLRGVELIQVIPS